MKPSRVQLLILFALLFAGGLVLVLAWPYRDQLTRESLEALIEGVAAMGPWVFFGLMAVLPLFWMPASPFLFLAPVFGLQTAVLGSACALSVNLLIAWFVSGKWFRPLFVRIVSRFGYSVPEVSSKSMVGVAVLLRITPGVPFPLQNYLLGLARMPLPKYLGVSLPIVWATSASIIVLGESVLTGNVQLALIAIAAAICVAFALKYWRGRLQAKSIMEEGLENGS
ncbi:TVP38/TMEM64 family protein [Pelagicoccus mobilis]|uniref:TVP38/TMEM64 family membrane protein n=1 Tax=Pelagicoccus mobilis TaxID=415221 RepID=A0A934RZV9_9BACT|nr:hypothetical protein [Pelagicoccus mobilis]MBK1876894.1 hypothetical protein [Pelagicoccus mobilis]